MVVSEGPNRSAPIEFLVSPANHPTYTFLYTLFQGRFNPVGAGANLYWTHVRKCFLDGAGRKSNREAIQCCKLYLRMELKTLKPRLVLAVGGSALEALYEFTGDLRLKTDRNRKLLDVFLDQQRDVYRNVKLEDIEFDVAVAPHPSGRSTLWNRLTQENSLKPLKAIENIMKAISKNIPL